MKTMDISFLRDMEYGTYNSLMFIGGSIAVTLAVGMSGLSTMWLLIIAAIVSLLGIGMKWFRFGEDYNQAECRLTKLERRLESLAVDLMDKVTQNESVSTQ